MSSFSVVDAKGGEVYGPKQWKLYQTPNTTNLKFYISKWYFKWFWLFGPKIGSKWIMELGGGLSPNITMWGQTCILASWLHIFIQILVLFACFGCVVINHQKGGDCKENGPRAICLIEFWCLMNNTIRELISFSVFVFSSQDARFTWTKELRKATPQKKTLRGSKKSPSVLLRTVCARRTGLSSAPGNSSPTASSRWHSEKRPPDCPVWKACGANGHLLWQSNG
jgi:hypothetical protein